MLIDFASFDGQSVILKNNSLNVVKFRLRSSTVTKGAPIPAYLRNIPRMSESAAKINRVLTLVEKVDYSGNSMLMLLNGSRWKMPVTEKVLINSLEIWSLVNLTQDPHPIHLHLVRFQVLDRKPFDQFAYNANGQIKYTGRALPPDANETGWKDTVRADPGMVTRIIMRFEGYIGRYVWHCHNLEHEDNEMMRPYEVVGSLGETLAVAGSGGFPVCSRSRN